MPGPETTTAAPTDTEAARPTSDQQPRRKPELTSDQGHHFPLRVSIAFDVPSRRSQVCMAGKLLDIPETTADLRDFPGGASDEGSATRMGGAADHAQARIKAMSVTNRTLRERARSTTLWGGTVTVTSILAPGF